MQPASGGHGPYKAIFCLNYHRQPLPGRTVRCADPASALCQTRIIRSLFGQLRCQPLYQTLRLIPLGWDSL